tara:strand:+ start:6791 stop:7654 length:864 start_codon:yes stop_codon:yes gene_type:complete
MGGGGKGGGGSEISDEAMAMAQDAKFKPYSLTSGVGTTQWDKASNAYTSNIRSDLTGLQDIGFGGAGALAGQIGESYGRDAAQLGFDRDLEGRTSDIFGQQSRLLAPQFAQQNQALKNDLFGSGRMGLMLAGEAAGAGAGGMVNPDAFGLGRAQSQTLAELAGSSRQQALGEQQQAYNIDSGLFGINQGQQQLRSQNLLAGASGLFGLGSSVNDIENQLMNLGLTAEQARGAASGQAGQVMAANTQQSSGGSDLLGSLIEGGARIAAASMTGGASEAAIATTKVATS